MKIMHQALVAALATAAFGTHAANLNVTGSVIPGACGVVVGNNGTVDLGRMAQSTVQSYGVERSALYIVPMRTVSFTVNCSAPTVFAIHPKDNRAGSALVLSGNDAPRLGLGMHNSQRVGAYLVDHALQLSTTAGGSMVAPIAYLSRPAGSPATPWTAEPATHFRPEVALAFATAPGTTPGAISQLSGSLYITTYLNKALVDSATTEIKLDGAMTLDLQYL